MYNEKRGVKVVLGLCKIAVPSLNLKHIKGYNQLWTFTRQMISKPSTNWFENSSVKSTKALRWRAFFCNFQVL